MREVLLVLAVIAVSLMMLFVWFDFIEPDRYVKYDTVAKTEPTTNAIYLECSYTIKELK